MAIKINGTTYDSTIYENDTMGHSTGYLISHADEYEPLRNNNFELVITGLDNLQVPTTDGSVPLPISDPQKVLRIATKRTSVPQFSQGVISVRRGNDVVKYAGVPDWPSGSFTFNEYVGQDTRMVLEAWRAACYNTKTGKVGITSDYKKTAYILEYTPDWQLVHTIKIRGLWPSEMSISDRDYEGNAVSELSVTFQYDRAESEYEGI